MAWDFTADSDQQKELATKLNTAADNFDSKVEAMYTQIGNMGTYWVGEDYNMYKEGTEGYRNALGDLSDSMRMFSKHFDSVAEGTEQLAGELASIIQNATGSSNYGGGATGSSGGMTPSTEAVTGGDAGEGDGVTTPSGSGSGSTGNPSSGNVASNEQNYGNPSGDKSSNGSDGTTTSSTGGTQNQNVTVQSGQKVTLNGEEVYFLMKDRSGNTYYTKSNEPNAQVFVSENGGALSPYTSYSNNNIVSREDFVNDRKHNLDYYWNTTYNNGTSPYQSVSEEIDSSFTAKVDNPSQGNIVYDTSYLNQQATTLNQMDLGQIGLGRENTPEVIYLAPNQSIKYDKPWDTYDNKIDGGANGAYLVYDSATDAYYKIAEDGSYNTGSDGTFGLWISREQLLDERTTFNR